jgi:triacylglycerol lipase
VNTQSAIDATLFVQFVANNWGTIDKSNNLDGRPVLNTANQPVVAGKAFNVIKTIYANGLATDIKPDRPLVEGYKTIGIVAGNVADPNEIVIAIRGTSTIWEWIQDAKFFLRPFDNVTGSGLTEDGFTVMYQSFSFTQEPAENPFMKGLLALLPAAGRVTIVGHSLGAGLATLLSLDFAAHSNLPLTVFTIASPRVGDLVFERVFNNAVRSCFRVVNRLDVVPKVPPALLFFHVGDESEYVPMKELKFDLACEHHLTSYLHLMASSIGTQAQYPIQANCLIGGMGLPLSNPSAN